jgi:hypothetical protein
VLEAGSRFEYAQRIIVVRPLDCCDKLRMAVIRPTRRAVAIVLFVACCATSASAATIEVLPYAVVDAPDGWVLSKPDGAVRPLETRGNVHGTVIGVLHPAGKKVGERPYAIVSEKHATFRPTVTEVNLAAQVSHGLHSGGEVIPREGPSTRLSKASSQSALRVSETLGEFEFETTYDAGKPTAHQSFVRSRFTPMHQLSIAIWADEAYARTHAAALGQLRDSLRPLPAPAAPPEEKTTAFQQWTNGARILLYAAILVITIVGVVTRLTGRREQPNNTAT